MGSPSRTDREGPADPTVALRGAMDEAAARGVTLPWGASATLTGSAGSVTCAARTFAGWMSQSTEAALALPVTCGGDAGLLVVTAAGNYKDEATILASSALVLAFAGELGAPLLADCDVAPALRRSVLDGHERIVALAQADVEVGRFGTVNGPRRHLRGIGASVFAAFVLRRRAWMTGVGECSAWLHRGGEARRLHVADTLARDPAYRARVAEDPRAAFEDAESVITHVLGATDAPPPFAVTRVDLEPGDHLLVASELFATDVATLTPAGDAEAATSICERIAEGTAARRGCPGIVAVVRV